MSVNPSELTSAVMLTSADIGKDVTLHGLVSVRSDSVTLVEPREDYRTERFPIGIEVLSMGPVTDGAYVIVRGELNTRPGAESYSNLVVSVSDSQVFEPDVPDDTRSQQKIAQTVLDIVHEHGDPIPARYVIERAGRLDFDREFVREVLQQMVDSGQLYRPHTGMIFGA